DLVDRLRDLLLQRLLVLHLLLEVGGAEARLRERREAVLRGRRRVELALLRERDARLRDLAGRHVDLRAAGGDLVGDPGAGERRLLLAGLRRVEAGDERRVALLGR